MSGKTIIGYKAVIKAYEDGFLVGEKREYYSAPFKRKKDAQAWLDKMMEQNEQVDRDIDYENSLVFRLKVPSRAVVKAMTDKPRQPAVTVGRKSR